MFSFYTIKKACKPFIQLVYTLYKKTLFCVALFIVSQYQQLRPVAIR
jgi:hypothetical protein